MGLDFTPCLSEGEYPARPFLELGAQSQAVPVRVLRDVRLLRFNRSTG